ncbi:MAG: ABC transporter ATP-binding protein [Acidaminococcales bacterium]|jgi:ABC-2 type transport system ATP-binding protein|nr:ABC transporter ATP-binding protein [Acidaminococcales bacterium]
MILETLDLKKYFAGKQILKGISLAIKRGEIFGIVGPDGAGKTTFIRSVLGLYRPDGGSVSLFGGAGSEYPKSRVGYVPQQFSLNADMTVWENIALFSRLYGLPEALWAARAEKLLDMVWLGDFKNRLADSLSGGMKQKLALICGVIHEPEALFLDEPTTGVDPVSRREFWQMLYRLNRAGLTVAIATPYMDEVELCTRAAFFNQGQIRLVGAPAELLALYPYKLFAVRADNLRLILRRTLDLPVRAAYLQGTRLHVALDGESGLPALEEALAAAGLGAFAITPVRPTLDDLFSFAAGLPGPAGPGIGRAADLAPAAASSGGAP